jgi:endonuclease YncB( thermonuclease family)
MKRLSRLTTISCCALLLILAPAIAVAEELQGKVVAVADGDTITVLDATNTQQRIRLQGIDAPERAQAFGTVSREHLADLVFGKRVTVQYGKRDKYGRIVGKVMVEGQDVCLEQVKAGLAWHYKEYQNEQSPEDRQLYAEAEQEARRARKGLWQDILPQSPWEYRHAGRGDAAPAPSQADKGNPPGTAAPTNGSIVGNRRSRIYHWPGCPNYNDISPQNREYFKTKEEAERAGYRPAKNCH